MDYARRSVTQIPENIRVIFQQGNIINYVRRPEENLKKLGVFDLVYSIGLADYLQDKLLKNMIVFSVGLLGKNGKTTYAFKIHDRDVAAPLPPKWFCDWHFIPRSLDESSEVMTDVAKEKFELEPVDWEQSGRVAFLTLRKK